MNKNDFHTLHLWAKQNLQYDLALEAHEALRGDSNIEIEGVSHVTSIEDDVEIHIVKVLNEKGMQQLQKPIGTYITIHSQTIFQNNYYEQDKLAKVIGKYLTSLLTINENEPILMIGLGNRNATPDALGPQIAEQTLATSHLFSHLPSNLLQGVRPVSVFVPGVLGMTGLETTDLIQALCTKFSPKTVIVCDALAASSPERIGTTIQLSNAGISPGAGVGNYRKELNQISLGIPVISIGIPTVISGTTIAHNILHHFFNQLEGNIFYKNLSQIPGSLFDKIIQDTLTPYQNQLNVTPKEIDDIIKNGSKIIAKGIANALHPNVNPQFALFLN